MIITHGNGPQVGNLLIQHACAQDQIPALPMDVCGAQSQGQIGYMIQQTLTNHLENLKINRPVTTIVTQVEVDSEDPAFKNPTKPVGPFYTKLQSQALVKAGFVVKEDAGRGYRRIVPSPQPKHIVEIQAINNLIGSGAIVIASGGGGIPVVKTKTGYHGVEAVIDKDFAGELLAEEVKADFLIILTEVKKVALNYLKPNQTNLDQLTVAEAEKYFNEGHFAPGSMGPKIQATIKFIKSGGQKAIITHPFKILEALKGKTGTTIV